MIIEKITIETDNTLFSLLDDIIIALLFENIIHSLKPKVKPRPTSHNTETKIYSRLSSTIKMSDVNRS